MSNNEIIKNIEQGQLKAEVPAFNTGDTVRVYNKIKEMYPDIVQRMGSDRIQQMIRQENVQDPEDLILSLQERIENEYEALEEGYYAEEESYDAFSDFFDISGFPKIC